MDWDIDIRHFGTTAAGQAVDVVTLQAGHLTARVLTFGATLQDLRHDEGMGALILGADDLAAYEQRLHWCGAVVGPVANRLAGARAMIAGQEWQAQPNEGANLLHSGAEGISQRIWSIEQVSRAAVTLRLKLPHGAAALPGNRVIRATYRLVPPATLELDLSATTDAETLMNLAHHPYWNLDGGASARNHEIRVAATRFLPTNCDNLPAAPVPASDHGLDLRLGRWLFDLPPLDHNYCPEPAEAGGLRPVAWLRGANGMGLRLDTDAPGLQVYDGRALDSGPFNGLMGQPIRAYDGVALEPQMWPDAPHHADFPPITLAPGALWLQRNRIHLSRSPDA